ncbi:MAG TPA: glycosyltransferase family 39 protein [Polyangiaceae bacterium]|nr:glycosyltransferase family 39 protein [Polyangiaceae bacterium]
MEEPLVPPGNALRLRALLYAVPALLALIVLMACDAHFALAVPLGLLALGVVGFGVLDFAGCFDDASEPSAPTAELTLGVLAPRLLLLAVCWLAWVLSLRLAVAGVAPTLRWLPPALVTLTSVGGVVAFGRLFAGFGPASGLPAPKLHERPGLWLTLLGVGLYVPLLGVYSLLDPWEPHYGEVAREMLARNDWISLWWAQEGWFWSKPVLDFWLQGLCFALLGVKFRPDEMLSAAGHGSLPQPEWAARLPVVLLTLIAVYALYRFVAAAAGKRAGFLAGLVLLCAPYWSLLAHQSMTDMPYVAPLTAALALFGLGLLTDAEQRAPSVALTAWGRTLRLSAAHGLLGLVVVGVVPQLTYLVSRQITLQLAAPPYGFRWHWDEFFSGSGLGNCGLPGNEACRMAAPSNALFQPILGALIFGAALGYFVWLNRGERRTKRLYYLAAWFATALAALAKGAPGLVLPLAIAGAVLVARRDWLELTRVELASLALLIAAVCLPWYVQAYMRHGDQFTDRLLIHDMYKRAFVHVHDTNAGSDISLRYYIWQLGYGLFPWTGLAPLGIGVALARGADQDPRWRDLALVIVLWLAVAFGLFTISLTKFHHYALPCAPPLAVGVALLLDRAMGVRQLPTGWRLARYLLGLAVAARLLIYGGMRLKDGSLFGRVSEGHPAPAGVAWLGGVALAVGLLLAVFAELRWGRREASVRDDDHASWATWALLAAPLTLLVARDLSTSLGGGDVRGSARLLHLVTYNYKRLWPDSLSFDAIQWGFGVAATSCLVLWLVPRFRFTGSALLSTVGVWFCAFTLWIYLPALAPHFGQRELLLTYYQKRQGPQEPVVAYQMNWKGENFYTGNRVPAFVSTGTKFKKWLKAQRKAGTKTIFFLSEHGRIGTLKSELGAGFRTRVLTDKQLNNKFALVRAELVAEPPNTSDNAAE